jgi:hypothetical protein
MGVGFVKKVHGISGLCVAAFVAAHLLNHSSVLWSAETIDTHVAMMRVLRVVYRNAIVEALLLLCCAIQSVSGLTLLHRRWSLKGLPLMERLRNWSGAYLSFFIVAHVVAVLSARATGIDTNFLFGVAGLNTWPFVLIFVPYYSAAIWSFLVHVAVNQKRAFLRSALLVLAFAFPPVLLYNMRGFEIPASSQVLM